MAVGAKDLEDLQREANLICYLLLPSLPTLAQIGALHIVKKSSTGGWIRRVEVVKVPLR